MSFMALPRVANRDEFSDDSQLPYFYSTARVFVFFLKAPYDEDTFMAEYLSGNYPFGEVAGTDLNPYIRRAFNIRSNYEFPSKLSGTRFLADGFTYTSDLHLAVSLHTTAPGASSTVMTPIIGRPTGYKAEGVRDYTTYQQLLRYYV